MAACPESDSAAREGGGCERRRRALRGETQHLRALAPTRASMQEAHAFALVTERASVEARAEHDHLRTAIEGRALD